MIQIVLTTMLHLKLTRDQPGVCSRDAQRTYQTMFADQAGGDIRVLAEAPISPSPVSLPGLNSPVEIIGAASRKECQASANRCECVGITSTDHGYS